MVKARLLYHNKTECLLVAGILAVVLKRLMREKMLEAEYTRYTGDIR